MINKYIVLSLVLLLSSCLAPPSTTLEKKATTVATVERFVLLLLLSSCLAPPAAVPEKKGRAVATLVRHVSGMHGSSYNVVHYVVNNRMYEGYVHPTASMAMGEKFMVAYDSLDPKNSDVITANPVFLPGEKTVYTVGTLVRIHQSYESFPFEYFAHGKKYSKVQDLAIGDPVKNHSQLINGAKFVVEYWEHDPQRAILYIDRPVKDSVSIHDK